MLVGIATSREYHDWYDWYGGDETHCVVLDTSFMPRKGSSASEERMMQGANTMARELADILLCSSSFATLERDASTKIAIKAVQMIRNKLQEESHCANRPGKSPVSPPHRGCGKV